MLCEADYKTYLAHINEYVVKENRQYDTMVYYEKR